MLENNSSEILVQHERNEIKIANELAAIFQKADNLGDFFKLVVEEAFSRINCEVAVLYIFTTGDPKILQKVAAKSEVDLQLLNFDTCIELGEGVIGSLPFTKNNLINLTGSIIETPNIIKNIVNNYLQTLPSKKYEHLMAIALEIGNKMFGVLKVINKKAPTYQTPEFLLSSGGFTLADVDIFRIIAKQTEFAYHSIKKLEDINRIHEIGATLTSQKKLNKVLYEICKSALDFFKADIITFYQYDQKRNLFLGEPLAIGDIFQRDLVMEKPRKNDVVSQIMEKSVSHFTSDALNDPFLSRKTSPGDRDASSYFIFREKIKSTAAILLKVNEEAVGVMFINYRRSKQFFQETIRLMEIFASYAAIAIKNAREKEELTNKLTFGLSELYSIHELAEKSSISDKESMIPKKVLEDILDFMGEKLGYYAEFNPGPDQLTIKYTSELYNGIQGLKWSIDRGLSGYAVTTREIKYVPDIRGDRHFTRFVNIVNDNFFQFDADKEVKSSLAVPLMYEDKVYGVFHIESNSFYNFSEYDIQMIKALVNQAANAIRNLKLVQQQELSRRKLQALHKLDILVGSTFNLNLILKLVVKIAKELTRTKAGQGSISLIEKVKGKKCLVRYTTSGVQRRILNIPLENVTGITRLAVIENRIINITDTDDLWKTYYRPGAKGTIRSALIVPLKVRQRSIGIINIESPVPHAFDKEDEELLNVLASQAVIVIQMTRLVLDLRNIGMAGIKRSKKEFIRLILEKAGELLGAEVGTIWLYDSSLDKLNFETFYGLKENIWQDLQDLNLKNSFIGHVLKNKKIIIGDTGKILNEKRFSRSHFEKLLKAGLKSIIAVPFYSGKELIGIMNLYSREEYRTRLKEWQRSWEKNLLELFATEASILLQNVQRYDELQIAKKEIERSVHHSIFDSMSRMVRLFTHRINNSVGGIRAEIDELLERSDEFDAEILEHFKDIRESAEEALNVPVELNNFVKRLNSEKSKIRIFDVIKDVVREIGFKNINFNYKTLNRLKPVRANYGIIKEVFTELFRNASRAMPGGGTIDLAGRIVGQKILEISVTDTGHGIPRKNLNKIFEYGFTDWKYAKGTGDGLALIKAVIELDHDGKISVESEEGKGSTFKVQLPLY